MMSDVEIRLTGIGASDGISIATAYKWIQPDLSFKHVHVGDNKVYAEISRLQDAVNDSKNELNELIELSKTDFDESTSKVFDAHVEIMSDPDFVSQIKDNIKDNHMNAESALDDVSNKYIGLFKSMVDDPYMQERASDVEDVYKRILSHLLGKKLPSTALIDRDVIIVAHELTPSDTVQFNKPFIKGLVTDVGGRTSHSAIMARTLEKPAVLGTKIATDEINTSDELIVDGIKGQVITNPTQEQLSDYKTRNTEFLKQKDEWKKLKAEPSLTKDGVNHTIMANIGSLNDVDAVIDNGGEGIGLFRTEFLYMDALNWPTEDEQFKSYKSILQKMDDKPVVIRTMDIGGDKDLSYADLPDELNPFMGYRAIRISLKQQNVFRVQLRSLLRASMYGNLWIMFPMIATLDELRLAKKIYHEEREKMIENGQKVGEIKIGMMMEIPAAAMLADRFAKEVDFMSIGTNDLIGYSMAADRTNENVSYLYQPYNPSILRFVKHIIDACHSQGKYVAMCGEMASDKIALPLLVGMGLDEFSMSSTSILKSRAIMKTLDSKLMSKLVDKAINLDTSEEVKKLVTDSLYAQ